MRPSVTSSMLVSQRKESLPCPMSKSKPWEAPRPHSPEHLALPPFRTPDSEKLPALSSTLPFPLESTCALPQCRSVFAQCLWRNAYAIRYIAPRLDSTPATVLGNPGVSVPVPCSAPCPTLGRDRPPKRLAPLALCPADAPFSIIRIDELPWAASFRFLETVCVCSTHNAGLCLLTAVAECPCNLLCCSEPPLNAGHSPWQLQCVRSFAIICPMPDPGP